MQKISLNKPKSFREAGDILLEKINLNNLQLEEFNYFLNNIIPRHLSGIIDRGEFSVKFIDWHLDYSELLPEQLCRETGETMEVPLKVNIELQTKDITSGEEIIVNHGSIGMMVELDRIPLLTDTGIFIINGVQNAMISHLGEARGIILEHVPEKKYRKLKLTGMYGSNIVFSQVKGKMVFVSVGQGDDREGKDNFRAKIPIQSFLKELGIEYEAEVNDLVGFNKGFKNIEDALVKTDSILLDAKSLILTAEDRNRVNKTLSFRDKIVGRSMARDMKYFSIKDNEEKTVYADTVINFDLADDLQNSGVGSVLIKTPFGEYPFLNNKFVDISFYVSDEDIPEELKIISVIEDSHEYIPVNHTVLQHILSEYKENPKLMLKNLLKVNIKDLVGFNLSHEDILAMTNLFSLFCVGIVEVEDRDSLVNKKVTNISSIFEDMFIDKIYGKYGLVDTISSSIAQLRLNKDTNAGFLNLKKIQRIKGLSMAERMVRDPLNRLFQRSSNLNPMDEISHKRKISLTKVDGYGGVNPDYSIPQARNVHPSHIGRLCPIETPEGKKVGLMLHLATTALVNKGEIKAPFFKIDHKTNTILYDEAIYLSYEEEKKLNRAYAPQIAEKDFATLTLYKNGIELEEIKLEPIIQEIDNKRQIINRDQLRILATKMYEEHKEADSFSLKMGLKDWFLEDYVDVIDKDGKLKVLPVKEVDIISSRGDHILSTTTSTIPFAEYDDGTRLMMGTSMAKQTEPVLGSEPPLIVTSMGRKIGKETEGVITSPVNGIIKYVTVNNIIIRSIPKDKDEEPEEIVVNLSHYKITSENTSVSNKAVVKVGDIVRKGDVIADTDATFNGEIATGTNLLVAMMIYEGYNFEDGILISEELVEKDILTSRRAEEVQVIFNHKINYTLEWYIKNKSANVFKDYRNKVDRTSKFYTLSLGTKINTGDILYVMYQERNQNIIDKPIIYKGEPGILIKVSTTEDGDNTIITFSILTEEYIKTGDKLSGRHGNKGVIAKIMPKSLMPYTEYGERVHIALTLLGIPSRMNIGQLCELQLGMLAKDCGIRIETVNGRKIDIPKIKMLTNSYTGNEEGKIQLYDGRTGRPFRNKTTVGVTTINKLKHLSSHKLSQRGIGKADEYLSNGQPTAGRNRNGGQVIGEMENWAFLADNAVENLREIQVYKSDDPSSRYRYEEELKGGERAPEYSNFPQTYKKAISYLRSMGLRMKHYHVDGREIDIYRDRVKETDLTTRIFVEESNFEDKQDYVENILNKDYEDADLDSRDFLLELIGGSDPISEEDQQKIDEVLSTSDDTEEIDEKELEMFLKSEVDTEDIIDKQDDLENTEWEDTEEDMVSEDELKKLFDRFNKPDKYLIDKESKEDDIEDMRNHNWFKDEVLTDLQDSEFNTSDSSDYEYDAYYDEDEYYGGVQKIKRKGRDFR